MTPEEREAIKEKYKALKRERLLAKQRIKNKKFRTVNHAHARAYAKEWRSRPENKEKEKATRRRYFAKNPLLKKDIHFRFRYGITLAQRDEMLTLQGNVCKICGTTTPGPKGWAVDHCHNTGAIRGILCMRCNGGMGMFNDDPQLLKKVLLYLENAR